MKHISNMTIFRKITCQISKMNLSNLYEKMIAVKVLYEVNNKLATYESFKNCGLNKKELTKLVMSNTKDASIVKKMDSLPAKI